MSFLGLFVSRLSEQLNPLNTKTSDTTKKPRGRPRLHPKKEETPAPLKPTEQPK